MTVNDAVTGSEGLAGQWHDTRYDEDDHCYSSCWCCCTACDHTNPHFNAAKAAIKAGKETPRDQP